MTLIYIGIAFALIVGVVVLVLIVGGDLRAEQAMWESEDREIQREIERYLGKLEPELAAFMASEWRREQ